MADEITPLISKEDIQDLVIEKKFVRIDSNRYTEEAYEYMTSNSCPEWFNSTYGGPMRWKKLSKIERIDPNL